MSKKIKMTDGERFWSQVHKSEHIATGMLTLCWLYGKGKRYGMIVVNGIQIYAHVYSWVLKGGQPPPKDFHLHHLCGKKRCVNTDHLVMCTEGGHNRLECMNTDAKCINGHPYDEVNPLFNAAGYRLCRECPPPPKSCFTPEQELYLDKVGKLANVHGNSALARLLNATENRVSDWIRSKLKIPTRYMKRIDELYAKL